LIIVFYKIPNKKAYTLSDSIVIDESKINNEREKNLILSEELGHYMAKSFYALCECNALLARNNIDKAERKAKDLGYSILIGIEELKKAIKKGNSDQDIAEILDIDLSVFYDIVNYYKRKNLL
jgi:hypothetical protein